MDSNLYTIPERNNIIADDLVQIASADLPWNKLEGKSIIVTGGSGFLASYLVKAILTANELFNLNCTVVCVVRSMTSVHFRLGSYVDHPHLKIVEHDVIKPFPEIYPQAQYIIHAASQASPKFYGIDPVGTLSTNSIGTSHLLSYAVKSKVKRFLFFSSGEVYGNHVKQNIRIGETNFGSIDPTDVRSCYAESKRMGETMCVSWAQQYGLHTIIVRPFHTYGPGMDLKDGRVFADFVSDIVNNKNLSIKSDGTARRAFLYISDATKAFLTVLLKGKKAGAYNVGNPNAEISIKDLAKTLTKLFPAKNLKAKFEKLSPKSPYLRSPIQHACPAIDKIQKLNWKPTISIEDGFRRTVLSFENI